MEEQRYKKVMDKVKHFRRKLRLAEKELRQLSPFVIQDGEIWYRKDDGTASKKIARSAEAFEACGFPLTPDLLSNRKIYAGNMAVDSIVVLLTYHSSLPYKRMWCLRKHQNYEEIDAYSVIEMVEKLEKGGETTERAKRAALAALGIETFD